MRLPTLTGEFRLTQDPELRFTPAGKAVCQLSLIASESRKNEQTGEWEDGDKTPFISASVWNQAAEAAAEELERGQRVLVSGQLYVREYERQDGSTGQSIELKWATVAAVPGGKSKASRERAGNGWAHGQQPQRQQAAPQQDPWATTAQDPWATPQAAAPQPQDPPF